MNLQYSAAILTVALITGPACADELTLMIEQDLERLGYDPGIVDGEETIETTIAISKFQAERQMEVTGEISRDLARTLVSTPEEDDLPAVTGASAASASAPDEAALYAAQEACLQEKVKTAKESVEKKRGLKRLFGAVARTATRFGGNSVVDAIHQVYSASATAEDVKTIADELGISEDDVLACKNP